jgi:hypothetical protein
MSRYDTVVERKTDKQVIDFCTIVAVIREQQLDRGSIHRTISDEQVCGLAEWVSVSTKCMTLRLTYICSDVRTGLVALKPTSPN